MVRDILEGDTEAVTTGYARSTAKKRKNRKRAKYSKKIAYVRNALKVV